jgi:hypothetical protein
MFRIVVFSALVWHSMMTFFSASRLVLKTIMFAGKLNPVFIFIISKLTEITILVGVLFYISRLLEKNGATKRMIFVTFSLFLAILVFGYFSVDLVSLLNTKDVNNQADRYNLMLYNKFMLSPQLLDLIHLIPFGLDPLLDLIPSLAVFLK